MCPKIHRGTPPRTGRRRKWEILVTEVPNSHQLPKDLDHSAQDTEDALLPWTYSTASPNGSTAEDGRRLITK